MNNNDKNSKVHLQLQDDLAYQYSVKNNDIFNMMAVLKANDLAGTFRDAELQVQWGQIVESITEYNATA
jgi:hypothetical protein